MRAAIGRIVYILSGTWTLVADAADGDADSSKSDHMARIVRELDIQRAPLHSLGS